MGLETRRRCGWLGFKEEAGAPVIWARKSAAVTSCPKSLVSADSETMLEDFLVRRRLGGIVLSELTAKQAEAFLILEQALATEKLDGEHRTR